MLIKSIQCPSCGGNLNVENIHQSLFYCQYCGAAVQLETNRNKGYDLEHGRLDARAEMADTILQRIEKIKPELIRNGNADYDIKNLPRVIGEYKADLSENRIYGTKDMVIRGFFKGLGVLFIGAFFVVALNKTLPTPLHTLLMILVGFAPIYIPAIGVFIVTRRSAEIKWQIARAEERLAQARRDYAESEAYLAQNAEIDIPPRFRSEPALIYMMKGLKAREFISLDQAIFRCEEAMARHEIPDTYLTF